PPPGRTPRPVPPQPAPRHHRRTAGSPGQRHKLVLAEHNHETAALLADLAGAEAAFTDGPGAAAALQPLRSRIMSVAWGTSEIQRNLIAERILGLPRDPLV